MIILTEVACFYHWSHLFPVNVCILLSDRSIFRWQNLESECLVNDSLNAVFDLFTICVAWEAKQGRAQNASSCVYLDFFKKEPRSWIFLLDCGHSSEITVLARLDGEFEAVHMRKKRRKHMNKPLCSIESYLRRDIVLICVLKRT